MKLSNAQTVDYLTGVPSAFESNISAFGERILHENGLEAVARLIASKEPLSLNQLKQVYQLPLPLISLLNRLRPELGELKAKPTSLLPLSRFIEQRGKRGAIESAVEHLERIITQLDSIPSIHIQLDSWSGRYKYMQLLEALYELNKIEFSKIKLWFFGPRTDELSSENPDGSFFEELKSVGIDNLSGGEDLSIHLAAMNAGLKTTITHQICVETPSSLRQFQANLFKLSMEELPLELWQEWIPVIDKTAIHQLARVVCLARFAVPRLKRITVPASYYGSSASILSTLFGANHIGQGAVDSFTIEGTSLPKYSSLCYQIGEAR